MDRIVYEVVSSDEVVFASLNKKAALAYIDARQGRMSPEPTYKLVPTVVDLDELRNEVLRRMTIVERLAFTPYDHEPVMRSVHRGIREVCDDVIGAITQPKKD